MQKIEKLKWRIQIDEEKRRKIESRDVREVKKKEIKINEHD